MLLGIVWTNIFQERALASLRMANRVSLSPARTRIETRQHCIGRKGEPGKVGELSGIIYSSSNSHHAMIGLAAGMKAKLIELLAS
jgi:hypothetical protein